MGTQRCAGGGHGGSLGVWVQDSVPLGGADTTRVPMDRGSSTGGGERYTRAGCWLWSLSAGHERFWTFWCRCFDAEHFYQFYFVLYFAFYNPSHSKLLVGIRLYLPHADKLKSEALTGSHGSH